MENNVNKLRSHLAVTRVREIAEAMYRMGM